MLKLTTLLAIFSVTCLTINCASAWGWGPTYHNATHNLIVGHRGYNDLLLFSRIVNNHSKFPWSKVSEDIKYPITKSGRKFMITEITAIDLIGYDQGGYASITKGGVGRSNVTIHFTSQRGKSYKFNVSIFGH
uniref:Heteropteran venom family 3 protein 3 n=1 Tax=Ectomocoris sp. TaxID=3104572 RepID=A0AB38ZED4_9HEMI